MPQDITPVAANAERSHEEFDLRASLPQCWRRLNSGPLLAAAHTGSATFVFTPRLLAPAASMSLQSGLGDLREQPVQEGTIAGPGPVADYLQRICRFRLPEMPLQPVARPYETGEADDCGDGGLIQFSGIAATRQNCCWPHRFVIKAAAASTAPLLLTFHGSVANSVQRAGAQRHNRLSEAVSRR